MATHTPGPIHFNRITTPHGWQEYDFVTRDPGAPGTMATARFYGENHEADARLWAAAPDLLAALEKFDLQMERWEADLDSDNDTLDRMCDLAVEARAALAKARGEG